MSSSDSTLLKRRPHRIPTNEELSHFCMAVRQKDEWERKIMDENIALKWAIEAELTPRDSECLKGEALEGISELRRSVLTIRKMDQEISLNPHTTASLPLGAITSIDTDFKNALKYARGSKHGLCEAKLKEGGLGVYISDDLVPISVHQELVRELDALAVREPRDYHPGSFGKVQDLIHPSLYPYVAGVTPTFPDTKLPPIIDGKFRTELSNLRTEKMASSYAWIPSVFKVSPDGTDVHINSYINGLGNREEFPRLFRVLEKMFLLALPHFEKTMEHSEQYESQDSPSVMRWYQRQQFASNNEDCLTRKTWNKFLATHTKQWEDQKLGELQAKETLQEEIRTEKTLKESFYKLGDEIVASDRYKGKDLKVIVKAANYTLASGRAYEGSWHMEGMPHERIVASAIYYFDTDSAIEDKGLSFRKFRDSTMDFPAVEDSTYRHEDFSLAFYKASDRNGDDDDDEGDVDEEPEYEDHYPSDWENELNYEGTLQPVSTGSLPSFIELGTVPTTNFSPGAVNGTGRILSFPNWLQHKVESVRNSSDSGECVATRKILCFFLVDDTRQNQRWISYHGFTFGGLENMNVLTTSEVPIQMRKCNEATLLALLPLISAQLTGGTPLPLELVIIIWEYVSAGTMTRREAEEHRLGLMNDRKVVAKRGRWDTYSLCEH